jgi:hypothetical protein
MPLTFDDLDIHHTLLKTYLKAVEPNLYVCFLEKSHTKYSILLSNNQTMEKLGYIILGIRVNGSSNFNTFAAANIYDNGVIDNIMMDDAMYNATVRWILNVDSQQVRYKKRLSAFKTELFSTVWHPASDLFASQK